MKKVAALVAILMLFGVVFACTPASAPAVADITPTPLPLSSPKSEIELADTPEALETLMRQYKDEGDFQRVYEAALRLTELDPENPDAYLAAAGALLAINEQNEQEMKRILSEGILNAPEGVQTISGWLSENGMEGIVQLPFVPDYADPSQVNTLGNTCGNIINSLRAAYWRGGFVATQAGWIYYSRFTDDYAALYKMRTDGSGQMKFEGVHGYSLNVVGDWIYFINPDDADTPYKMRTDGSELQKLSDYSCSSISVCGDWVYSDGYGDNSTYYKMRTDGSEQSELTDFTVVSNFCDGESGYVIKKSMEDGGVIRVPLDGSKQIRVVNDIPFKGFLVAEDCVYYVDSNDSWVIKKVDLDGTNVKEVYRAPDMITAFNLYEDKLIVGYGEYATNGDNTIGREVAIVDLTTGETIRSWEAHTDPLCVGEGFLFYTEDNEGMRWHCVNIETGEELKME